MSFPSTISIHFTIRDQDRVHLEDMKNYLYDFFSALGFAEVEITYAVEY